MSYARFVRVFAPYFVSVHLLACLERPIGTTQPRTTNVLTDELVNSAVTKIDLLFVVDNSASMADKQVLLAEALPDLVRGLVDPPCLTRDGENLGRPANGECPAGSSRQFDPVDDIHVGVITSSLGGYGSEGDCVVTSEPHSEQKVDRAHLLGTLPRGATAAPSAARTGFLSWTKDSNLDAFTSEFTALVTRAGERGCGWEAPLEAWLRFLVDPHPYLDVVRRPCSDGDTSNGCVGPSRGPDGGMLIDTVLLQQRREFLRPDSLLAIVMLSDENDCSFRPDGRTWLLSQSQTPKRPYFPAFKAAAACNDPAYGPESACCRSCGFVDVPEECPTALDEEGELVALGCEGGRYYAHDDGDAPNLRCFQQKRRFGFDFLYPVERYSNALTLRTICPFADDLSPTSTRCPGGEGVVVNPLYADLRYDPSDPEAVEKVPRSNDLVFFAGIVGVPWQDLAVSIRETDPLVYRRHNAQGEYGEVPALDWSWVIGDRYPEDGIPKPQNPLMRESIEPRSGLVPSTGEPVAPPESSAEANSINGHEWRILRQNDLQYACTFPLTEPVDCLAQSAADGTSNASCDCAETGSDAHKNPLCQQPDGGYGGVQRRAKAYPSLRQLQALHDFGENSVVASICPKTMARDALDYGYRPVIASIVERLTDTLSDKCYTRGLATRGDGSVACIIVEASAVAAGDTSVCGAKARSEVNEAAAKSVRKKLLEIGYCRDPVQCEQLRLCEIEQLRAESDPVGFESCRNDAVALGNGWCYIDEARGLGNPALLERCPSTARRKVRYAGDGKPGPNTITVVSCAGESFDDER